ncbi:site-specific integrase [Ideonella sp. DXS22W]|uniref:Site-specific integrase n=1 Tax=Pseudaquabacterium inlustre TaxID=2984192 RepID=A0ABU9CA00_9BURK
MKRATGVYLRPGSNIWQWAVKAPADLKHLYPGQWAHRVSLGTADLREANTLAARLRAEWLARFDQQRRPGQTPTALAPTDGGPAVLAKVQACLHVLMQQKLQTLDYRVALMRPDERQAAADGYDATLDFAEEAAHETDRTEPEALALLGEALAAAGIPQATLTTDSRRACERAAQLARTRLLALQLEAVENPGGPYEKRRAWLPPAEHSTSAPASVDTRAALAPPGLHSPADAFKAWLDAKPGRPRKTVEAYRAAADRLAQHLGDKPLERMDRKDGRDFVAELMTEAKSRGRTSQNTAANILGRCKTLMTQAVDLEWIKSNPLQGRTIERVKVDRKPWTLPDLIRLFDDPLFTRYQIPTASAAGKDAAYWLPLLGLYTGARISELAQLGIDDLRHMDDAGWVLAIHEQGEDQSVKNEHSIRSVPVHPELIRLGLTDYHRAIKDARATRLWPAVVFTDLNGAGGKVSQWFGQYKTAKGFGPDLVFHSFRHTLETELRALSVPRYHIAALAGHASSDVSDDYAHPTPTVLRPHLERLRFPGLNLPRVFAAPAWTASTTPRSASTKTRSNARQVRSTLSEGPGLSYT